MSPSATSLLLGSALRALTAAPLPRPPQPMRPTFKTLFSAAWTSFGTDIAAAAAPTATAPRTTSRRLGCWLDAGVGLLVRVGVDAMAGLRRKRDSSYERARAARPRGCGPAQ